MTYPTNSIPSINPQNFAVATPVGCEKNPRNPTASDNTFIPGCEWQNTASGHFFKCVSATVAGAVWTPFIPSAAGTVSTLTANSGGMVGPDGSGNINVVGDGTTINIVGNPGTNTLTASLVGGDVAAQSFVTNVNPSVVPTAAGVVDLNASTSTYTDGTVANTIKIELQGTSHALFVGRGNHSPATTIATGSSGQVLTSGGAGSDPSWETISLIAFTSINVQTFTYTGSPQTYTPTSGMLYCIIECVGGGGAGGGCANDGAGTQATAGGGGAGSYSRKFASAATIGASQVVTIGAAGAAGATGDNPGGSGGNTSVGAICTANGGGGGSGNISSQVYGGTGGAAGTGDIAIIGNAGQPGAGSTIVTTQSVSGAGASSFYGPGATAVVGVGQTGASAAAGAYGAGGSGGFCFNNSASVAGGSGAAGIVVVTEFV